MKNYKIHFYPMKKKPHGKILKRELNEQYLSTVSKFCSFFFKGGNWQNKYLNSFLLHEDKKIALLMALRLDITSFLLLFDS